MQQINHLQSLAGISTDDCLQTKGSFPVRVLCTDFNYYICKYFRGEGPAYSLFNEYIAACFLNTWELNPPEFAFVKIKQEHIREIPYPNHYFSRSCFGSLYHQEFKDVDNLFVGISVTGTNLEHLKETFLKIAFFDIWLSNEDRTGNNYNLLFDFRKY